MKNSKLVATEYNNFKACFKFDNNEVSELFLSGVSLYNVNDIYIGRVSNIKEDIKACFVDISPNETGFLPFSEIYPGSLINREYDGRLKQGDYVCVQITKEKIKTKGFSLSMNLTVPGNYSVVTVSDKAVHYSSKLNKEQIETLSQRLDSLKYDFGYIVRTNAVNVSLELLLDELDCNQNICSNIVKTFNSRSLYTCLYKGKSSLYEKINSLNKQNYDEIITDNVDIYEELKHSFNVRLYNDNQIPLKAIYSFDKAFDLATSKKVYLKSGGYLIIEPTEALTVIDVNSGKFDKNIKKEDAVRKINLDACVEIARQLKLRNLSGIIIVDFINNESKDNDNELIQVLKKEFKKDICKANCIGVTPLGLVEITREKRYSSIYDQLKY